MLTSSNAGNRDAYVWPILISVSLTPGPYSSRAGGLGAGRAPGRGSGAPRCRVQARAALDDPGLERVGALQTTGVTAEDQRDVLGVPKSHVTDARSVVRCSNAALSCRP